MNNGKIIGPVLGSPAAYSSVAASLLENKTGLVTTIGRDMSFYLIKPIVDAGVDIKGINIKGENSRSTKLIYDNMGNKKVIYEKIAPDILFEDIPIDYLQASVFFICPMDFEVPLETISKLQKYNKLMMTDLGGFGGTVSEMHPCSGIKKNIKAVKDIVSKFNIVKLSMEDSRYLFSDSITRNEILKTLHEWGPEIVIITIGEKGSVVSDGKKGWKIPVFKTPSVDTTGAGDVYCASFLSRYLMTKDLYNSGLYASAAASILTEKSCGVNITRMPLDENIKKRAMSLGGRLKYEQQEKRSIHF